MERFELEQLSPDERRVRVDPPVFAERGHYRILATRAAWLPRRR